MKDQTREEPKIVAAAERQMQAWVLSGEMEDRAIRSRRLQQLAEGVHHYLAISREAGAGGGAIAQRVGRLLGWDVLDRNLIDRVANRFGISRVMLELVDETQSNWVYDVLGTWMDRKIVPHEKYVTLLTRVVLAAARQADVVLVGRGAQFLLPRDRGLAVRIVASERYRIERTAELEGISLSAARRQVQEIDRGRGDFVQRFFHHHAGDPHLYDLVINVERLGQDAAADLIVAAYRKRLEAAGPVPTPHYPFTAGAPNQAAER